VDSISLQRASVFKSRPEFSHCMYFDVLTAVVADNKRDLNHIILPCPQQVLDIPDKYSYNTSVVSVVSSRVKHITYMIG